MTDKKGEQKAKKREAAETRGRSRLRREAERTVPKKKKKEREGPGSPAKGGEKKKSKKNKRKREGRDFDEEELREKKARQAKRRRSDSSGESSSSPSRDKLFGEVGPDTDCGGGARGHKDRGPFGGSEVQRFKGQDAPADRKATSQQRLTRYAQKMPGRLVSRLLLKMLKESAHGSAGAITKDPNPMFIT